MLQVISNTWIFFIEEAFVEKKDQETNMDTAQYFKTYIFHVFS